MLEERIFTVVIFEPKTEEVAANLTSYCPIGTFATFVAVIHPLVRSASE
jgi:hypothetical protein